MLQTETTDDGNADRHRRSAFSGFKEKGIKWQAGVAKCVKNVLNCNKGGKLSLLYMR